MQFFESEKKMGFFYFAREVIFAGGEIIMAIIHDLQILHLFHFKVKKFGRIFIRR